MKEQTKEEVTNCFLEKLEMINFLLFMGFFIFSKHVRPKLLCGTDTSGIRKFVTLLKIIRCPSLAE
jgi:hypothetical protein